MSSLKRLVIAVFAAIGLTAVPALAQNTITDFVAQSGGEFDSNPYDYDFLLNAVIAADLAGALADPNADLTVFAPNDFAFMRLASDLGWDGNGGEKGAWNAIVGVLTELGGGDPIPVLTTILTYHVAPESLTFIDVIILSFFGETITTLQGGEITPRWRYLESYRARDDLP